MRYLVVGGPNLSDGTIVLVHVRGGMREARFGDLFPLDEMTYADRLIESGRARVVARDRGEWVLVPWSKRAPEPAETDEEERPAPIFVDHPCP